MTKYTLEVATNAPKGVWRVADRTFWDRRLTIGEKQRAWAHIDDLSTLAAALSTLKIEGEDITEEWLTEVLTETDTALIFAFILGGSEQVARLLAKNDGT